MTTTTPKEIAARLARLNERAARAGLKVSALFTVTTTAGNFVSYNDKIEDAEAAIRDALEAKVAADRAAEADDYRAQLETLRAAHRQRSIFPAGLSA